jgi:hypothetical protein
MIQTKIAGELHSGASIAQAAIAAAENARYREKALR